MPYCENCGVLRTSGAKACDQCHKPFRQEKQPTSLRSRLIWITLGALVFIWISAVARSGRTPVATPPMESASFDTSGASANPTRADTLVAAARKVVASAITNGIIGAPNYGSVTRVTVGPDFVGASYSLKRDVAIAIELVSRQRGNDALRVEFYDWRTGRRIGSYDAISDLEWQGP